DFSILGEHALILALRDGVEAGPFTHDHAPKHPADFGKRLLLSCGSLPVQERPGLLIRAVPSIQQLPKFLLGQRSRIWCDARSPYARFPGDCEASCVCWATTGSRDRRTTVSKPKEPMQKTIVGEAGTRSSKAAGCLARIVFVDARRDWTLRGVYERRIRAA